MKESKASKNTCFRAFKVRVRPATYFLGIEVAQSKTWIAICQINILKEISMLGYKPIDMPMNPHVKLRPDQGEPYSDSVNY